VPVPTFRPRVTLKLATSLDGRIATASGQSRWITGEQARAKVHALRAAHDAILVGIETALADDPELTVRMPGYAGKHPVRVVLDSRQRLPDAAKLVRTARQTPTWIVTTQPPQARLEAAGVRLFQVSADAGRPDLGAALECLAAEGVASLFVEGGGQVAASFLRAELVDVIEWFRAPILLGGEGRPAVGGLGLEALASAPRYLRTSVVALGDDLHEHYEAIRPEPKA
jgi:diaminohydroxyphosphoribosylaminopyrimidine deaminase/5-amino-6-(5-phosphoribosylamino)uracil reductase